MQDLIDLPKRCFITIVNRDEDEQLLLWNGSDWSRILEGCFRTNSIKMMEDELIRMSAMDIEGDPVVIQLPEGVEEGIAGVGVKVFLSGTHSRIILDYRLTFWLRVV